MDCRESCAQAELNGLLLAVQELGLALNEITGEGAAALATFLPGRTILECLSLRENEMETGGAMQLAEALPSLQGLRELDLCRNQVRPLYSLTSLIGYSPFPEKPFG